jgi:hypothetical protein
MMGRFSSPRDRPDLAMATLADAIQWLAEMQQRGLARCYFHSILFEMASFPLKICALYPVLFMKPGTFIVNSWVGAYGTAVIRGVSAEETHIPAVPTFL